MAHPTLTTFTPSEISRITGVSAATQLDWRRRGLLLSEEGGRYTLYDITDIAEFALLKHLIDLGVTLSKVKPVQALAVELIVRHAEMAFARMRDHPNDDAPERFVVCPAERAFRTLAEVERQDSRFAAFIVIDCEAIGEMINQNSIKPLWRVE